ncbi:uncharacterized protein N0V89_005494 [Didymosphaeria variabile]|uniref:Uncharacterized protein n=1 Tax=Didymosphaeria variabile TaxID=1932322 RepID=A0A9W8XLK1_9PLEO|nr:uncharacterized protein N0V89_005494 [Didymosphaeria variabile]KAJ4353764.1 hypothetical protein N0V89_005494 [Didymosphaeria variabile]
MCFLNKPARKVKVKKRRSQDGSGKLYTAFVVAGEGAEERVLIMDRNLYSSEEEAVRRLSVMLVEEWREKQGMNFF